MESSDDENPPIPATEWVETLGGEDLSDSEIECGFELLANEEDRKRKKGGNGDPPGGPGGDPGGGGGGPNGPSTPPSIPYAINPMDTWRQVGNNKETNLMDGPDVTTLREWKQHCVRTVAGASPDVRAAQQWVMEAMGPTVAKPCRIRGNS